ncbi:MAG: cytochrome BD ubiquinol oxidase subunit II [Deltaproteobacteria bacterium]|nr:cytochrome BD ubiquinol oxidase subunit II [Deltaproteobacteria bacterium]HCH63760.1 cytochrome BD ubiquinol oxidase subunit II [Deltaproteobacteria bacterium]
MPEPSSLMAGVMLVALVVYTLTGGADFGGGVWDLLASGPRKLEQRRRIAQAIAPIWEANHVWLIVVVVVMFVCFPPAFAAVSTVMHIPLTLMLFGIVLRGTAFVFRAYDPQNEDEATGPWRLVFAVASTITPIMLGMVLGGITSGTFRFEPGSMRVSTDFVSEWAAAFPVMVGVYGLALCALLAAVYLIHDTADAPDLQEDFRIRALAAAVFTGPLAFGTLAVARLGAPHIYDALVSSSLALPLHVGTGIVALGAIGAIWTRRYGVARVLVIAQTMGIFAGLGAAQFPYLVAPQLTFSDAAAPDHVLWAVLGILCAGGLLLVPAFVWLYSVFKGQSSPRLH